MRSNVRTITDIWCVSRHARDVSNQVPALSLIASRLQAVSSPPAPPPPPLPLWSCTERGSVGRAENGGKRRDCSQSNRVNFLGLCFNVLGFMNACKEQPAVLTWHATRSTHSLILYQVVSLLSILTSCSEGICHTHRALGIASRRRSGVRAAALEAKSLWNFFCHNVTDL